MPATFTVQSIVPNNGKKRIARIHFTRNGMNPSDVYYNVTGDLLALLFNAEVREGDTWEFAQATLKSRAGSNGVERT